MTKTFLFPNFQTYSYVRGFLKLQFTSDKPPVNGDRIAIRSVVHCLEAKPAMGHRTSDELPHQHQESGSSIKDKMAGLPKTRCYSFEISLGKGSQLIFENIIKSASNIRNTRKMHLKENLWPSFKSRPKYF